MTCKRLAALFSALVLLLAAAACSGTTGSDAAASQPPSSTRAPLTAQQIAFIGQCEDIVRAYDLWHTQIAWNFKWIDGTRDSSEAAFITKEGLEDIKKYTDALFLAAKGRADQPSKNLAVAVADFNVKRAMVALENTLGDSFKPETYQAMRDAAVPVNTALANFKVTCPPLR